MTTPDDYITMNCGIKIPIINIFDDEGTELSIAPKEALRLLEDAEGEIAGEEEEGIDEAIFYYADHFEKDEVMLAEIKASTGIEELTLESPDE